MADREIRLIGSFQDDITPKLTRLNRQLLGTLKQFEKLQNKIAPVAAEMAKFNSAAMATAGNLKTQRSAIEENIRMLRQYRTELSKTSTAQSRMGGGIRPPRIPRGGGGGGGGVTPAPMSRNARRGGGGSGVVGGAVFGATLGSQLSGVVTGSITAGFQAGVQLMYGPFQFFANALAERIRDEMSDVRTAGGLFAISKRQKDPVFKTFTEAESYTKEQNRYLAKLAGALPGDTQEYIQVSKQISDGIFTIVSQDKANATKLAQQLAAERGATAQEIAKLSGSGASAMQQTGKELVGEMTKLTVLAGLGGQQGAYGLPQLTERMLAEDQVSMGMFQRYAAIFRDPMIKGALERNIKNINAAGKNTTARLEALRNTFKEIVTPELVRRYQRTTAGVLEALKTSFLNPEVGLLGLGRPLTASAAKFDEFGNRMVVLSKSITLNGQKLEKGSEVSSAALTKAGFKLEEVGKAAMDNLSIFDYLRDIFANLMIVLQPIIDNLVNLFDPFTRLGNVLATFRERTMQFQNAFERYRLGLEDLAKGMKGEAKAIFQGTIPLRAAIGAINDAMAAYGGYGEDGMAEFKRVAKMLKDPTTTPKQMGEIIKGILDKFLSSDFAKKIGEALGTVIGTVISQVGEMMKAAAGLATGSKLAEGFAAGFQAAGGPQGIRDIIQSVFHLFVKLVLEIIKAAPLESAIAAALFFLPGAIAGLIGEAISGGFARAVGGGGRGGRGGRGGGGSAFLGSRPARGISRFQRGVKTATSPIAPVAKTMMGMNPGRSLIRQRGIAGMAMRDVVRAGKYVPGGALAFGAVDAGIRMADGQGPGKAIGGAAASVIGSTLGGILGQALIPVPGLGATIGGIAGGFIGNAVFDAATNAFAGPSQAQREAAAAQKAAAEVAVTEGNIAGVDTGFNLGTASQLQAKLQAAGLYTPPTTADIGAGKLGGSGQAAGFLQAYTVRNLALEAAKSAATELRSKERALAGRELPPKVVERVLKPLKDKAISTAKVAEAQERVLTRQFEKLPKAAQEAFTKSIAGMPMTLPSMALANVISGIKPPEIQPQGFVYPTPAGGLSLPTPPGNPYPPNPSNPLGIDMSLFNRTPAPSQKPKKRAFGGPVSSGQMYMVGERGPEMFISNTAGRIIPNDAMGGTSVNVGTINVSGGNAGEIADQIASELLTAMYRKSRAEVFTS